jgi:hypothetical protein
LSELLAEQVSFLRSSAAAYDGGELAEAKRLATTVSTLVNSNRRGTSVALLSQIGVRDHMSFLSYAEPLQFRFPKVCLVIAQINSTTGGTFIPICHSPMGTRYLPQQWVAFETWWRSEPIYEVVLDDGTTGTLSRMDLVRYLRSQDGGSHIDADITEETYVRLSRIADTGAYAFTGDGMAGMVAVPGEGTSPIPVGHLAAMRHIAFELEQSLIRAGLAQPQQLPEASA